MPHISGKAGQVDAATGVPVTGIKSWTLDYTADTLETTDFADIGVKSYIVGGSGWSGTFEGFKDVAPLGLTTGGTAIDLKLWEATAGAFWSGKAWITGISINNSHDGIVSYSYTFQGTAGLTVAAS